MLKTPAPNIFICHHTDSGGVLKGIFNSPFSFTCGFCSVSHAMISIIWCENPVKMTRNSLQFTPKYFLGQI